MSPRLTDVEVYLPPQLHKGPGPLQPDHLEGVQGDFVLTHPVAKTFYDWLYNTRVSDEHFYSTLESIQIMSKAERSVTQIVEENMRYI